VDTRLADVLRDAVPFSLPLTRPFRGITRREGVLLRGPSGWGEFAPFADYDPHRAAPWLASAVEAAFGAWPQVQRSSVTVNAIIPAVGADQAASMARAAVLDQGCRTIKIKVGAPGETLADDESRVVSVRDAADRALQSLGEVGSIELRIDANAAWDLATAERALNRLGAYQLQYVEQPCRAVADLRALRSRVDVPIAVDESLRIDQLSPPQLREVADVVIVKAGPLGGAWRALEIVKDLDLPVVVSGGLDSAVGLTSGVMLAAALPAVDGVVLASGLGTGALLDADVVKPVRVPINGMLDVGRVSPDLDALMQARDRLDDDAARQWRQRIVDAWVAGGESLVEQLPDPA